LAGPGGPALTIVALADDPALLDAIARAGSDCDVIITSPTVDRFIDQLVANAAAVAVIDAACAPPPLEQFVERIQTQFPQLLLILAGSATLQAAFAARLVDGTLFRFAHKPASAQRMRLFVDAARRHLQAGVPAIEPDRPRASSPLRTPVTGAALLLILLSLGWWYLKPSTAPPPALVTSPAVRSAIAVPGEPVVDDPLASEVAARTAAMIAQANALPPVAAATPPGPFLQLARARLASRDLIEPERDSALFYVEAAQALAPDDPEVDATALALGEALVAQTRAALNAGDAQAARRWLHACTEYRVNPNTIVELAARLQQLEAAP
jgi:hypothetical protein